MAEELEKEVFKEYLDLALRYKYVIGSIVFLFLVIGIVLYKLEIPEYTASATLLISAGKGSTIEGSYSIANPVDAGVITALATSPETIAQAIKELTLYNKTIVPDILTVVKMKLGMAEDPYDSFLEQVRYYRENVKVDGKSIIRINVNDQNPQTAADIANKIAEIIVDKIKREKDSELSRSMSYIDEQLSTTQKLLLDDRKSLVDLEVSQSYNAVVSMQERIAEAEDLLREYKRKVRDYENKIELEFSGVLTPEEVTKKEQYLEQKSFYENAIEDLQKKLELYKDQYAEIDKADYYKVSEIQSRLEIDEKIYSNLMQDKQKLIIGELFTPERLKFLSRAWKPTIPDRLAGIKNVFILVGMGFIVSMGVVFTLQFFERKFANVDEVEEELGLDVLGNVPRFKKGDEEKIKKMTESSVVEAYKTLRTNIHFADKAGKLRIIGITSAESETGKSFTAQNLGKVMAGSGDKVLIIDCDLRKPTLHHYFNIKRKPGLTDILGGNAKLDKTMVKVQNNLYFLPSGSLHYNPQKVMESKQMKDLLEKLKTRFDRIICDSIPVLTASEAELLAFLVDSNIFVIDTKRSTKPRVLKTKQALGKIGANILGVVLNNKKRSRKSYYYYHYYK
jgi:capsular exopolysaccharide synthesis family protein